MSPYLAPELVALADQEHADINEMLEEYPTFKNYLLSSFRAQEAARLVAIDCLARLSENADQSPSRMLAIVTARLHAWDTVCRP